MGTSPIPTRDEGDPRPSWRNTRQTGTTAKRTANCEKPPQAGTVFRSCSGLALRSIYPWKTNQACSAIQVGSAKLRLDLPDDGQRVSLEWRRASLHSGSHRPSWTSPDPGRSAPLDRSRIYSRHERYALSGYALATRAGANPRPVELVCHVVLRATTGRPYSLEDEPLTQDKRRSRQREVSQPSHLAPGDRP
jgi:hypothetical protein